MNAPATVFVGEKFKFTVKLDNASPTDAGFAPYIQVVLPGGGVDLYTGNIKCDGITRDPAVAPQMISVNGGPIPLNYFETSTAPCMPATAGPVVTHSLSGVPSVNVPPGGQLLTIELPNGSFEPDQDEVVVEIAAVVSDYADVEQPLTIYATGGFRLGADEYDNPSTDKPVYADAANTSGVTNAAAWVAQAPVTPKLLTLLKASTAPEGEAVSGPNFVNYYPLRYALLVNIADGQTVKDLLVTDKLPTNAQYAGPLQVNINGAAATVLAACPSAPGPLDVAVLQQPVAGTPDGTLIVQLCSPVTGSLSDKDVEIIFAFYIPEKDSLNQDILAPDCSNAPVDVINDGSVKGDWTPLDPRDQPGTSCPTCTTNFLSDETNKDNVLSAKCLAIQKLGPTKVPPVSGTPGFLPGDTVQYELRFQISDYRTMGKIVIRDFLSDGQDYVPNSAFLQVSDQFGPKMGTIPAAALSVVNYYKNVFPQTCLAKPEGSLVLTFNVSQAMGLLPPSLWRLNAGILTGGHAAGTPTAPVPAHGRIIFRTKIRDDYRSLLTPPQPSRFVDKHDLLSNCVAAGASVYKNVQKPSPPNANANIPTQIIGKTTDGSAVKFRIKSPTFKKSVYAVRRGNGCRRPSASAPSRASTCASRSSSSARASSPLIT